MEPLTLVSLIIFLQAAGYLVMRVLVVDSRIDLRRRLNGYALLKAKCPNDVGDCERFEVLLGTLKKVEGKNAVLTGVITVAVVLAAGSIGMEAGGAQIDVLAIAFLAALLIPLWLSFAGMTQLDQLQMARSSGKSPDCIAESLRRDLESDLLRKEHSFRFAKAAVQLSFAVYLAATIINSLELLQ